VEITNWIILSSRQVVDSNLPRNEPILNGFIYDKKYKNPFKKGRYL
jgi:hypothetical protein